MTWQERDGSWTHPERGIVGEVDTMGFDRPRFKWRCGHLVVASFPTAKSAMDYADAYPIRPKPSSASIASALDSVDASSEAE